MAAWFSLSFSHDWLLFADGTAGQSESIQVVSECIGWLLLVSICTDIEDQDMLVGTERWFSMLKNPDVSMVNLDCYKLGILDSWGCE